MSALWTCMALVISLVPHAARAQEPTARPLKTLRVAFSAAETGFDPVQIGDGYSFNITSHIFESLYRYDHFARPVKVRPLVAAAMPEVSDDFRTWTIRLREDVYFADDPAFKGVRRQLVAQDWVYSLKRYADPALKSQHWSDIESLGISGLAALRQRALDSRQPLDYERPIDGLRALDRFTLQIRVDRKRPRLLQNLIGGYRGAVAREVVEAYGTEIMEHPVGTGPFRLAAWRRSSQIVLERNPGFREMRYDAEPAADDTEGQAILARLGGRRLPMVDRVEVSIVDEGQPRWLAFLQGRLDTLEVPSTFAPLAMPYGRLAPFLAHRGVRGYEEATPTVDYLYFNMRDATVGGYTPEQVALRRAISLAIDVPRLIAIVRGGKGRTAHSGISAQTQGYDPLMRSEMGSHDPARARALLDVYGFIDRDGDGWRDRPDGSPLRLRQATQPDQLARQNDELMKRDMNAIGLHISFDAAQWPEQLKASRAGTLMMWRLGWGSGPDGLDGLVRLHGPAAGGFNASFFALPAFDAVYDRLLALPDGPEREALFVDAQRLAIAYMPEKVLLHRVTTYLAQPWVDGYREPQLWGEWYHLVDVDVGLRAARE
jgi:ABC-type transport system substrate-binding protein